MTDPILTPEQEMHKVRNLLEPWGASSSYSYAPDVPNVDATITLPAPGESLRWVLAMIQWSYNQTPTGGELTIQEGGTQMHKDYITSGGPGFHYYNPPRQFAPNTYVVVILAAGGAETYGALNLHCKIG